MVAKTPPASDESYFIRKELSDVIFFHTRSIPMSNCIELDHNSYNGELYDKPWDWVDNIRLIIECWNVVNSEKKK